MDKQDFLNIIKKAKYIALATSVNNEPNVRIVNCLWQDGTLYFSTMKGAPKLAEIDTNKKVAFTTLPADSMAFVRVSKAEAKTSEKTAAELKEAFIAQDPTMEHVFAAVGTEAFQMGEIHFTEADVCIDFGNFGHIAL